METEIIPRNVIKAKKLVDAHIKYAKQQAKTEPLKYTHLVEV